MLWSMQLKCEIRGYEILCKTFPDILATVLNSPRTTLLLKVHCILDGKLFSLEEKADQQHSMKNH
jgi:hypothetical protein